MLQADDSIMLMTCTSEQVRLLSQQLLDCVIFGAHLIRMWTNGLSVLRSFQKWLYGKYLKSVQKCF